MPTQRNNPGRTPASQSGPQRQYPPRMARSQPQLATAYAPGAMFTWEGGKGACISVPAADGHSNRFFHASDPTRSDHRYPRGVLPDLAVARPEHRNNRPAPVYEMQLLDNCFHNPMHRAPHSVDISLDRFEFLRPERMGYLPGPLVYRCDHCALLREYISPAHQVAEPLCRTECGRRSTPSRVLPGVNSTSSMCIGPAGSRGSRPIATRIDRGGGRAEDSALPMRR